MVDKGYLYTKTAFIGRINRSLLLDGMEMK
ncbi:hypothetical protein BSG1_02610 [Bacillus sp. SG-1]|nr:hypothetical protein BSG1_02610 [Bacillus sp. SG-1]